MSGVRVCGCAQQQRKTTNLALGFSVLEKVLKLHLDAIVDGVCPPALHALDLEDSLAAVVEDILEDALAQEDGAGDVVARVVADNIAKHCRQGKK